MLCRLSYWKRTAYKVAGPIPDTGSVFHRDENKLVKHATLAVAVALFGWHAAFIFVALYFFRIGLSWTLAYKLTKGMEPKPLKFEDRSGHFPDFSFIRFREHCDGQFFARQIVLATYIFLPPNWRSSAAYEHPEFNAQLYHEIGHCMTGDLVEVDYWIGELLPALLALVVMLGVFVWRLLHGEPDFGLLVVSITLACAAIAALFHILRQLPGLFFAMEFAADKFAHSYEPEIYRAFIAGNIAMEKYNPARKAKRKALATLYSDLRKPLSFLRKYFHPPWELRLQHLEHGATYTNRKKFTDGAAVAVLVFLAPLIFFFSDAYQNVAWNLEGAPYLILAAYFQSLFLGNEAIRLSKYVSFFDAPKEPFANAYVLIAFSTLIAFWFSGVLNLSLISLSLFAIATLIYIYFVCVVTAHFESRKGIIRLSYLGILYLLAAIFAAAFFTLFPPSFGFWFAVCVVVLYLGRMIGAPIASESAIQNLANSQNRDVNELRRNLEPSDLEHRASVLNSDRIRKWADLAEDFLLKLHGHRKWSETPPDREPTS